MTWPLLFLVLFIAGGLLHVLLHTRSGAAMAYLAFVMATVGTSLIVGGILSE